MSIKYYVEIEKDIYNYVKKENLTKEQFKKHGGVLYLANKEYSEIVEEYPDVTFDFFLNCLWDSFQNPMNKGLYE